MRTTTSFNTVRRGPRPQAIPDPADRRPQTGDIDTHAATIVNDGTNLDDIVKWADGQPDRITAILAAEAAKPNPRKTLPGRLAPPKENG